MRLRVKFVAALVFVALMPEAFGQTSQSHSTQSDNTSPSSAAAAPIQTVLELFTSQGCSSCPAADAMLTSFAQRPGIIALSLSVDYWDHLGWKDTLASPKNTARQKAYAKALGTGNIYTPQMVINGVAEVVGNNKTEIEKAIAGTSLNSGLNSGKAAPTLTATSEGDRLTIEVVPAASEQAHKACTVWLAVLAPRIEVDVKRGENRGRLLSYHNVVRELTAVGMWSGKPVKIELPLEALMGAGQRGAVLLQAGEGGRIIAATWMTP
jgi:hypothetical protein